MKITIRFGAMIIMLFLVIIACSDNKPSGKELAANYCQSCHLLPDPSLLPKQNWQNPVLPVMGLFLGTTPITVTPNAIERSMFASVPAMSKDEWKRLTEYYISEAPDQLIPARAVDVTHELPMFDIQYPADDKLFGTVAITSFAAIDTLSKIHSVVIGNSMTNELLQFDKDLVLQKNSNAGGPVVSATNWNGLKFICKIGTSVIANDSSNGAIYESDRLRFGAILIDSLSRPVQISSADLDNDKIDDLLICEYGNLVGRVSWISGKDAEHKKQVIKNQPGPLKAVIKDIDHDGDRDVITLFAQGDECISLFLNNGKGIFKERRLLRFPPSYGSSSFELVDFNHDGYDDIIYTCGDNGDYTRILKPYHGIYIYLNDRYNNFNRKEFIPMNGCYKAMARDMDNDGDLDIAAVSFFPSSATPWESFMFFRNDNNIFKAFTLPAGSRFQKGVTMDIGDADKDGKLDIILGSGYYSSDVNAEKQPLFILLKGK